jgi:hypothetical protein
VDKQLVILCERGRRWKTLENRRVAVKTSLEMTKTDLERSRSGIDKIYLVFGCKFRPYISFNPSRILPLAGVRPVKR